MTDLPSSPWAASSSSSHGCLLTVVADRLAGRDDASADRARDLRALGMVDATVGAEDDVLAGLHACPAKTAQVGSSAVIAITSEGITATPPILGPTRDTSRW